MDCALVFLLRQHEHFESNFSQFDSGVELDNFLNHFSCVLIHTCIVKQIILIRAVPELPKRKPKTYKPKKINQHTKNKTKAKPKTNPPKKIFPPSS